MNEDDKKILKAARRSGKTLTTMDKAKDQLERMQGVKLEEQEILKDEEIKQILIDALQEIDLLSTKWEGRSNAPHWNLGDIARSALKRYYFEKEKHTEEWKRRISKIEPIKPYKNAPRGKHGGLSS